MAPDALTDLAISIICSSLSTEHGPAIIPKWFPPTRVPFTLITVSSGLNNLFAFLKGSSTFNILSTPLKVNILFESILLVSPTTPIIQKVSPWERWVPNPCLVN